MSNMFKCLADCADLDLVNDCTATDAAERRYPYPGQRVPGVTRQEASTGTGESVKRGEEEEGEEEEVEEEDEEDPAYDEGDINSLDEEGYPDEEQFDDSLEHAPDAGERTGEYPEDDASRQDITPRMSPVVGPPFMAQTQKPSLESGTSISRESEVSPSGSYDVAPAARYGAPVPPVPPFPSASVSEPAPAPAVAPDGTSAAEAHASAAAAEGLRASTGAADAVAAAAAAADAGSQEEAEAAADRAAKAAAIAASSAANALKLAQEAGKAAAAEQALVDSTAERGGVGMAQGSAVAIPEVETAPAPVPGASHEDDDPTPEMASPRPGQMEAAAEYDPRRPLSVSSAVRSTSMGAPVASGDQSIGSVESTLSRQMPGRMSEPALSASPGATEVRSLQMPARMSEGERTRVMARRMQTDWAPEGAEETAAPRPRTFVSTRLRHLRLSQDGTTLVVKSEKGGVDHELALDELLEVHETPSEESVTLMGQDIEIRIAFKGQAKALRQFRTMLVPAGSATVVASPSTGNAAGGGNPPTTITTIREESPGEAASSPAQDRPASVVSLPRNGSENGSEGRVPVPVEVSTAGQYGAPLLSSSYSADTQRGAMGGDSGRFRLDATGAIDGDATRSLGNIGGSSGQQQQRQEGAGEGEGQVGGVEETEMPEGTANPPVSRNMSAASSFTSTGSAIDVLSKFDAQDRGADADAAAAAARGSCSGSTFADARERERVIAALQSDDNTMSPVEREAKLHLVKYEQAGFVRGYEALCDQQQVRLRKRPEFAELETIGVKEGLANPTIVLMQPNISESVEAHHADAIKAKEALDKLMDNISGEIQGLWVRPVPVKEESAVNSTANKDYAGDVRRVLDMARTSVICESPELVRQVVDRLKSHPDVSGVDRVKNGFGDTTVGRGGYRDIKVYLQLAGIAHYVEVQVHLREFYELNSRSHEVYEWARGVDLPEGTTPHLLFRNLSPDVQVEMTRLVKEDWMGLRRILPELLQATEQYSEAEPLLRQNVEEAEKRWIMAKNRFGEGHLHEMSCAQGVAMALNNLALALKGGGDTRGAEPLLRRALKMSEDSQGPDHPEVATRLNSLALLLASDGRVQEAEEMHRRALDIARKVYGPEHADVATYLNNLARVLKAQDKLGEAEPLQRSALSIGERMLGTNHSDVATYYNNLSRLVRAAGKLEEAEPLQRRAVEIGEQVLGPNSSDLATWVNNLGRLLMARKKLEEAKEVQERAVAIAENVYGPDHPQVARARKNLTKVQVALDKAGRSRGSGAPDTDMDA